MRELETLFSLTSACPPGVVAPPAGQGLCPPGMPTHTPRLLDCRSFASWSLLVGRAGPPGLPLYRSWLRLVPTLLEDLACLVKLGQHVRFLALRAPSWVFGCHLGNRIDPGQKVPGIFRRT